MMGKISKIWRNELDDGRKYATLAINGEKYTLWNNKYMDTLKEGDAIEYDFKQSGRYKNITNIDKKTGSRPENAKEQDNNGKDNHDFSRNLNNLYNSSISPALKKDREIVRMSCIKSAMYLTNDLIDLDLFDRADKVVDVARKFEKYVTDFEDSPDFLNPNDG